MPCIDDEDLPETQSLVVRSAWRSRHGSAQLCASHIRDVLAGNVAPHENAIFTFQLLADTTVTVETIRVNPRNEKSRITACTKVHIVPALGPSLSSTLHVPCASLIPLRAFVRSATRDTSSRMDVALVYSLAPALVATVCKAEQVPLIRAHATHIHRGTSVLAALQALLQSAVAAASCTLLIDAVDLLAPPSLHTAANSLALALRSAPPSSVAVVLLARGHSASAVHPVVTAVTNTVFDGRELQPNGDTSSNTTNTPVHNLFRKLANAEQQQQRQQKDAAAKVSAAVPGVERAKRALQLAFSRHPPSSSSLSASAPRGVLLYGAPGTGKTLLVRECARAAERSVIALSAAELARGEVGLAEACLRDAFGGAMRDSHKVVLFLDEIDALFSATSPGGSHARLATTLALCLDNAAKHASLPVVAATNRPWAVSQAVTRAGRLELAVMAHMPHCGERAEIAHFYATKMGVPEDVKLKIREMAQAHRANGLTGADIAGACRRAAMNAIAEGREIEQKDVVFAFENVRPSVHKIDAERIALWKPP